jgi:predicted Zn finger-like uncharacterized protein
MLIVCPNCGTSYDIDGASLRPHGRRVRCVRCRNVWHAELPHADRLVAAADALGPSRRGIEAEAAAAEPPQADHSAFGTSADAAPPADTDAFDAPADDAAGGAEAPVFDESPQVESPSIAPDDFDGDHVVVDTASEWGAGGDGAADEQIEDIESAAARDTSGSSEGGRWGRLSLSRLQALILGLIVVNAIIVGWRSEIVKVMPQTASFYAAVGMPVNLRGLSFDNLTTATEQHEGVPILVVEGSILNTTRKMVDVPHLRFSVRNAARQEIYSWSSVPPRPVLPPGETVAFHARLASPPPDAHDVLVRFLNRYDVMNGAH